MLQVMIRVMMNLKKYAENHGNNVIFIFVFVDLKREIKEDIAFVMRAKKRIWKQHLRRRLFDYHLK